LRAAHERLHGGGCGFAEAEGRMEAAAAAAAARRTARRRGGRRGLDMAGAWSCWIAAPPAPRLRRIRRIWSGLLLGRRIGKSPARAKWTGGRDMRAPPVNER
jgi:hypothetical protein